MAEVARVVVTGTESTGKTRLTARLAAHFGAPWSAEFAREFWDRHGGIGAGDLDAIGRGQVANEDRAVAAARRLALHDTDLITCVLWNDLLFPGACPAWVRCEAERRSRGVALYLLCEADVPFAPDPQRCFPGESERQAAARRWREAVRTHGERVVAITGAWAERERAAIAAVERVLVEPISRIT